MIKNKKAAQRPEITIIGARPMNESPLNSDVFSRARQIPSPTEYQKENDKPVNGYTVVSRTATLPSSRGHEKKQRPKSEIYNGFSSLRPTKTTKVDFEQLRKDSKKVMRSKSLHAPKKPPRDLPIRPAPNPPIHGTHETRSPVGQSVSISPTRPAPPVPFTSFNKKEPENRLMAAEAPKKDDKNENAKRTRSKSTSTVNEKSKPRGPATLPRGGSFHNHGPRPFMKPTIEENVVILTRTNSVDESKEKDFKLKSFGAKAAKPTVHTSRRESTSSSIVENEDTNPDPVESPTKDDVQNTSNGCITLNDAIHANAVYARLRKKQEEIVSMESEPKTQEPIQENPKSNKGLSLSDAISSSAILTKLKEKHKTLDENGVPHAVAKQDITIDTTLPNGITQEDTHVKSKDVTEDKASLPTRLDGPPDPVKPLASYLVMNAKNASKSNNNDTDKVTEDQSVAKPPVRKKSAPPAVKPKPPLAKRPSFEKSNQRSFDEGSSKERSSPMIINSRNSVIKTSSPVNSNADEKLVSNKFPGNIQSEEINNRASKRVPNRKNVIKEREEEQEENVAQSIEKTETEVEGKGIKDVNDRTIAQSEITEDDVFYESKHLPLAKSVSMPVTSTNENRQEKAKSDSTTEHEDKNMEEDSLNESPTPLKKRSESEPESNGSVDSLTSLSSQVTVIYNGEPVAHGVDNNSLRGTPAPFESHSTLDRQKGAPEPYSSHPTRRTKPGKPEPTSGTLKTKNRKSRTVKGRRLTSSPPSTPPPPPRLSSSDSASNLNAANQPPVPPRAPSMYIQNDMRSLDSMVTETQGPEKDMTKSPPPPRPLKPPSVICKHAFMAVTKGSSVKNNDGNVGALQNAVIDNRDTNETSEFTSSKQSKTTRMPLESNENFTQKLVFFEGNVEKTKQQKQTLTKQRSLDSNSKNSSTSDVEILHDKTVEQLRREGEEALAIVARLRKENGDVKVVTRKKSPAPQKPKRPLSFSMENFKMCEAVESKEESDVNAKQTNKRAPPKPGRSLTSFKSHSIDDRKLDVWKAVEGSNVNFVELRSKDVGLYENLKVTNEKKTVPKKPVRTSSLKVKGTEKIKIEIKKNVFEEKLLERPEMGNTEKEQGMDSNTNNTDIVDGVVQRKSSDGNEEKLEAVIRNEAVLSRGLCDESGKIVNTSNAHQIGTQLEGNNSNDLRRTNRDIEKPSTVDCIDMNRESESKQNGLSDALTNQIEQLDKILLETSNVLSESYCSIDNSFGTQQISDVENVESRRPETETSLPISEDLTEFDSGLATIDSSEKAGFRSQNAESGNHEGLPTQLEINENANSNTEKFNEQNNSLNDLRSSSLSKPIAAHVVNNSEECKIIGSNNAKIVDQIVHENSHNGSNDTRPLDSKADANDNCEISKLGLFEPCKSENAIKQDLPVGHSAELNVNTIKKDTEKKPIDRELSSLNEPEIALSSDTHKYDVTGKALESQNPIPNQSPPKAPPYKPPRPVSFQKVLKTTNIMNSKQRDSNVDPQRASSLPTTPEKEHHPRRKSAPGRPGAPPSAYRSRPRIPSILRENSNDVTTEKAARPHAVALFDYVTSDSKDLIFKEGDVIHLEYKLNADWYYGSINGRMGMFPATYVNVVIPLLANSDDPQVDDDLLTLDRPFALAIYNFFAGNENELTFESGDTIELLQKKNEDWYEGRCKGRQGLFPASFVVIVKGLPDEDYSLEIGQSEPSTESLVAVKTVNKTEQGLLNSQKPDCNGDLDSSSEYPSARQDLAGKYCTSVADYNGGAEGDLSFKAGQRIKIISRVDNEWLCGAISDQTGIFPENFVKIIDGKVDTTNAGVENGENDNSELIIGSEKHQ